MMMLKERDIQKIQYTKSNSDSGTMNRFEVTERVIIPTFVPKPNIKAIDVTDLSDDKCQNVQQLLNEYNEYVREQTKKIFKFEDWVSHTKNEDVSVKWRTFKVENIKIL